MPLTADSSKAKAKGMEVQAINLSKRYDYSWILRDWSYTFTAGSKIGVSGRNGSGKSTLIKMLSGFLPPSKGEVKHSIDGQAVSVDRLYKHAALVAPYTNLIQEFTVTEMFAFHTKLRKMQGGVSVEEFIDIVQLPKAKQQIQYFSSGMNQRLQLALHILSDTPLLLLDEPTSYLDTNAKQWTYDLLDKHTTNRTVIISSNDVADFGLVSTVVDLQTTT